MGSLHVGALGPQPLEADLHAKALLGVERSAPEPQARDPDGAVQRGDPASEAVEPTLKILGDDALAGDRAQLREAKHCFLHLPDRNTERELSSPFSSAALDTRGRDEAAELAGDPSRRVGRVGKLVRVADSELDPHVDVAGTVACRFSIRRRKWNLRGATHPSELAPHALADGRRHGAVNLAGRAVPEGAGADDCARDRSKAHGREDECQATPREPSPASRRGYERPYALPDGLRRRRRARAQLDCEPLHSRLPVRLREGSSEKLLESLRGDQLRSSATERAIRHSHVRSDARRGS